MSCLHPLWLIADRGHLCTCPLRNSLGYKDPHPEISRLGNAQQQAPHGTAQRNSNLSAHPLWLLYCIALLDQGLRKTGALQTWPQILYRLVRLTPVPTPRPYMLTLFRKNNEYWQIFIRGRNLPGIHPCLLGLLWQWEKEQDQKAQETVKVASLWHRRY